MDADTWERRAVFWSSERLVVGGGTTSMRSPFDLIEMAGMLSEMSFSDDKVSGV